MATSVLDRFREAQKLNPGGSSTIPSSLKRNYFPLKSSAIPLSSGFSRPGVPVRYAGNKSAFVE